MTSRLVHRGPDDRGFYSDERVAFGFRRLAIIDIARGQQPMASEDGLIRVVFNGEIYNHRLLRRELEARGHRFRTACDTEVLVHGYREWGSDLPRHLSGMFAFACWDRREQTALLARDRMGKKPLSYLLHDGSLWFASELKALLEVPGWSRAIDAGALDVFLAQQFIPAPLTIYREAKKLPPAHVMEIRAGGFEIRPYWQPRFAPKLTGDTRELAEELRTRCRAAVRRRLESDVPLGAFLSGGIDSSIVVGLMAENSSQRVRSYTIGFSEEAYDELPYARQVSEHFDTDHHEHVVKPQVSSDLWQILGQYDEPYADKSAVPTWYVAREAARDISVVLNGDGADDIFAGYGRHLVGPLGRWVSSRPPRWRRGLERRLLRLLAQRRQAGVLRYRLQRFARRHLVPLARSILIEGFFGGGDKARLYTPEFSAQVGDGGMQTLATELHAGSAQLPELIDRMIDVDLGQYLAGDLLPKVDISTMAHSIEARSPFMDTDVVEFALRLPDRVRVAGGTGKSLLKHAFADFLPKGIAYRKKQGFSLPVDRWLAGELAPMVRELLLEKSQGLEDFFRPQEVRRLVEEHVSGRRRHGGKLWALLCFEIWRRQNQTPA